MKYRGWGGCEGKNTLRISRCREKWSCLKYFGFEHAGLSHYKEGPSPDHTSHMI